MSQRDPVSIVAHCPSPDIFWNQSDFFGARLLVQRFDKVLDLDRAIVDEVGDRNRPIVERVLTIHGL